MAYGQQGNSFYPNSAQRWSRDKVEELFDQSRCDGSVPLSYIETVTGGADLKGNWAIRSYIEASFLSACLKEFREGAEEAGLVKRRAPAGSADHARVRFPDH